MFLGPILPDHPWPQSYYADRVTVGTSLLGPKGNWNDDWDIEAGCRRRTHPWRTQCDPEHEPPATKTSRISKIETWTRKKKKRKSLSLQTTLHLVRTSSTSSLSTDRSPVSGRTPGRVPVTSVDAGETRTPGDRTLTGTHLDKRTTKKKKGRLIDFRMSGGGGVEGKTLRVS